MNSRDKEDEVEAVHGKPIRHKRKLDEMRLKHMGVHREVELEHGSRPCIPTSEVLALIAGELCHFFGGVMDAVFSRMPESATSHDKDLAVPDFLGTRLLSLGKDKKEPLLKKIVVPDGYSRPWLETQSV